MTDIVEELAAEFAPDLLRKQLLDEIIWDEQKTLWPGTDFRDGKLWLTLPIQRPTERKVGRGKDATTEIYNRATTLLINSDAEIREYEKGSVEGLGFSYPPIYYHDTNPSRWQPKDMKDWILRPKAPTGAEIHAQLKAVYQEYVEFADPILYETLPLWIMASYVYRIFNAMGYIHFNGSAASGKSQNLKLLQAFGLNTRFTSNTSIAALFRTVASHPGILCLDEAESFRDDAGQDLLRLLKQGYVRGAAVDRTEKLSPDTPYQPIAFPVYSPKALASINTQDPVLTSRCIVVNMVPAIRRIPEFNIEDTRWRDLRNSLYRWALMHGPRVAEIAEEWNRTKRHIEAPNLVGRQWQVTQSYFIIADSCGLSALIAPMVEYFGTYYEAQRQALNDTDKLRMAVRCLPEVIRTKKPIYGENYYLLQDIYDVVVSHMESDALDKFKTTSVARLLKPAGFKTTKQTRSGLAYQLPKESIIYYMEHYGITPFDEDTGWESASWATQTATITSEDEGPQLDWLDTYVEDQ